MKTNKKEEGFALVTVLLFVLIILLIGTAAIALANNDVLISAKHKEEMQAFYAAEAGLTRAVEKVKKGGLIPPLPSPPLGEIVSGIISDPSGSNPSYPAAYEVVSIKEGEEIRLNSTGYVGRKSDYQAKAEVSALLNYKLQPAFEYAFFGPVFSFEEVNKWNISGKIYTHDELKIPNMGNNDEINATFYFFGDQNQVTIDNDNSWTVEKYDKRWVLTDEWDNFIAIEFMDSALPMPEVDADVLKQKAQADQTYYSGNQNFTSWEIDFKNKPVRFIDGNLTINAGLIYSGRGIVAAKGKINLVGPNNHQGEIKAKENDTSSRLILISFAESNPAIYINDFNLLNAIFFAPKGKIELERKSNSGITINGALIGEDIKIPDDKGEKITINYDPSLYFTNGIPLGIGQWQMEKWEQLP